MNSTWKVFGLASLVAVAGSGCSTTYSRLTSAHGLGAGEYEPAVLVPPGREQLYRQHLQACSQVAANRQETAAREGQQQTLNDTLTGAVGGAQSGYGIGYVFKASGFGGSTTNSALAGAGLGALGGAAWALSSGSTKVSDETKRVLLNCLRKLSAEGGYTVLE